MKRLYKSALKTILRIGDKESLSQNYNFLFSVLIDKKKFNKINNIFIYQTNKNFDNLKEIINKDQSNIKLINLTKICKEPKSCNIYKFNNYIENGISFMGIDV